jgi:hypothetical protein
VYLLKEGMRSNQLARSLAFARDSYVSVSLAPNQLMVPYDFAGSGLLS